MQITVSMGAEEFEAFRACQKDSEALKRRYGAALDRLRRTHGELCNAVLKGLTDEPDPPDAEDAGRVAVITAQAFALKAIDLATEFYA